jgi:hypothetical protein
MTGRVSRPDLHLFAEDGTAIWHGCDEDLPRHAR